MSLARVAIAAAAVYALLCAAVFLLQDRMIYQPWRELTLSPSAVGLQYEDVRFRTSDGVALHGWFIPAEKPSGGVLLFFHGNAGNISHRLDSIRVFHDLGLNVFIFDYRGYGLSEGRPSEEGFYSDGKAALGVLLDKGFSPGEIVVFGRSLGGAVAARVSAGTTPGALILESSFTSLASLASRVVPLFPVRLLLRSGYRTELFLPQVQCPVLVVHSPDDEMIPFSHGAKLFELAPGPKTFMQITGDHNEGFLTSGPLYCNGLASFLSSIRDE
ncbi:MAG: alpha/beta hydrolase [Thermovirgaceae bacterium]|nr:alpha/beta hydrolase [Thermovirgaceae bacterium]